MENYNHGIKYKILVLISDKYLNFSNKIATLRTPMFVISLHSFFRNGFTLQFVFKLATAFRNKEKRKKKTMSSTVATMDN
jgi:hypothetical protein